MVSAFYKNQESHSLLYPATEQRSNPAFQYVIVIAQKPIAFPSSKGETPEGPMGGASAGESLDAK